MDIRSWLKSLELEQYADAFEGNDLTFDDLSGLTADELRDDLGIASLGHRKKLLKAIEDLGGMSDEERRIVSDYPYLLSFPLRMMLEEKNCFQKLQLMKDVFLNLLKYVGLLTATEYFFSSMKNTEINSLFREKLYQPHFGHWNHFIREVLSILKDQGHRFMIPELPEYYERVQTGKKSRKYPLESRYTDDTGEVQTEKKSLTAIDGLINFRNRYIGHGVTLSQEQSRVVFETYYPLLLHLLTELEFCTRYPIFRYKEGRILRLMGAAAEPAEENGGGGKPSESIWIATPGGTRIPLLPFFVPPEQYMAEFSAGIQLFIYEQYTSRRILYFSPEQTQGEAAGEPVTLLDRMLEEKSRLPDTPASALTGTVLNGICGEISRATVRELEQEKKIIPGTYQKREENEAELDSFLKSERPLYFIAAEAGSGKTNLLTEVWRERAEQGQPCLLLRAGRIEEESIGDTLHRYFRLPEGDAPSEIAAFHEPGASPLLVLLDRVNEHRAPQKFLDSMGQFLERCPPGSVKPVVSWRINSPEDFPEPFPGLEDLIFSTNAEYAAAGGTVLQRSAGRLKPMNRKEIEGAWTNYGNHKQKIYKPLFSLADLEGKDRSFAAGLSNPLLLRMFLELYNGKPLSAKLRMVRIWPAWFENLKQRVPGSGEFLMSLTEEIFRRGETELDLDGLYDHPLLREIMRQLQIDSPYRRLLTLGVLSQYFRNGYLVVSFTLEAVYHYLLSRYLTDRLHIDAGEGFVKILGEKGSLPGIREAVGLALVDNVAAGGTLLAEYLSLPEAAPEAAALALAKALELGEPEAVVTGLAERNLVTASETLLLADYSLERNLLTDVRYRAFGALARIAETEGAPADLLFRILWRHNVVAHERGKYEEALEYAMKMEEALNGMKSSDETLRGRADNRLAVAYRKLMRSVDAETARGYGEKALYYAAEALSIMEGILPASNPELWQLYDNMEKVHEYRGEWKAAIDFGKKRIDAIEAALDGWNPLLASAYNNTAIVLREDGQEEASVSFSEHAMEIVSRSLDPNHIEMAYANWTLANTYDKFGKPEEAAASIRKTIAILRKLLPPDHPNLSMAEKTLAGFLEKL